MSVERMRAECMQFLLRKYVNQLPEGISEEEKLDYLQRMLRILADAPRTVGAPVIVRDVNALQKEMFGREEDFSEIKVHFNEVMLGREAEARTEIEAAPDPLKCAVQYAMVGNYIDFGAMNHVEEAYLTRLFAEAKTQNVDEACLEALRQDLSGAGRLVLLTDNCGEIVMDKLLLEQIQKQYPEIEITVIVRGEPVLNDATREDAEQVGLTERVKVLDNGNGIGGTRIEELSPEAAGALEAADVILAKGQGNFETMRSCGRNVYYMFLCKCDMFARNFRVPRYTGMMVRDADWDRG